MSGGADRLFIRDLRLRAILGINDWEREKKQDVVVNLTLFVDSRRAGLSDDVEDSVNYRTIAKAVIAYVEASSHFLVEALAERIARLVVVEHGAEGAIVRVEKPGALRFADSVGIEIERHRSDFE